MPEFAVHQYHVIRRKYLITADSAEAAATLADATAHQLTPVEEEETDEVQAHVLVDLLGERGEPIYSASRWLECKDGQFVPG
ncbi:hypothetical protein [Chromobacterium amazonense]|uniref:hypothetical protein n=1 Tax=Chromobacterium amazonense TaxID=1382803 RepID=UPI003F7AEEFB